MVILDQKKLSTIFDLHFKSLQEKGFQIRIEALSHLYEKYIIVIGDYSKKLLKKSVNLFIQEIVF